MENGFDFETGHLYGDFGKIKFDIQIRGSKVQVIGDSATGKTLIANILKSDRISGRFNNMSDYPNVCVIDVASEDLDITHYSNSLIVIDRGDLILTSEMVSIICRDRKNKYLVFARRALGLGLSPNYFGRLKLNNSGFIYLDYMFSEKGWF